MEVENSADTQDVDGMANDVNASLGMDGGAEVNSEPQESQATEAKDKGQQNETLAVQKRLKSQKRAHEREVRELHQRIGELEQRMQSQPNAMQIPQQVQPGVNPQMSNTMGGMQPMQGMQSAGMEDPIHRAVNLALQQRDMQERKALEQQQMAYVNRQYNDLHKHLEKLSDKYDDFHDVVMGHDAPFTPAMRDYSLTLPKTGPGSAGEVLYKLGKNPEELSRIAKLHPLDQASEMSRLSHALIAGGENKGKVPEQPLGNIKSNPIVNNAQISDKTPVSELRARMKAGRGWGK